MISTELLLTGPTGFDLPASPLQLALVRAADGLPIGDELEDDAVLRHFGCERSALGLVAPVLVVVVAGVRAGKSLIAACAAVKGSLTADLSALKSHEIARFACVAPNVDNATATFRLLVGSVLASPKLRSLVVGEPTSDTIVIRRPDGREVEIVVVAASRGAVTLRSRWLAGFVLDEVALFGSEPTGAVVNAEELLRAAETRLVPGGQGWLISSPFGPQGLLHAMYVDHFGKPDRVLVCHAPTRAMNPSFPAEQVEAIRARQPDVAAREYDAAWIDAETAFFDGASIERATRKAPLIVDREDACDYVCVIDPGFRANAWTMAIATQRQTPAGVKHAIVHAREWRGSKVAPLSPRAVFAEMRVDLDRYRIRDVYSDQASGDALRDVARLEGINLIVEASTQASKLSMYANLATLLHTDSAELPPVAAVRQDLLGVRKRIGRNGVSVDLSRTADGRHSDFAPSVAGALAKAVVPPRVKKQPTVAEREAAEKRARFEQFKNEKERPHWQAPGGAADRGPLAHWRRDSMQWRRFTR